MRAEVRDDGCKIRAGDMLRGGGVRKGANLGHECEVDDLRAEVHVGRARETHIVREYGGIELDKAGAKDRLARLVMALAPKIFEEWTQTCVDLVPV